MTKTQNILFILIVLLGLFLRTFDLAQNPVGLHGDEASIGYNAYSLLKTGKDQNGNVLPLAIDQFGDFRPAGYHYLDIPFVAVLGLNALAVRLPAALFGTASIIVFFFLIRTLFKHELLALLASLFLAISPWHITISRATSESVIAMFFVLLGTLIWIKGNRPKLLAISAGSFVVSFLFYHAARVFVPIMLIPLILYKRVTKASLVTFVGIVLALLLILKGSQGLGRPTTVSLLNIPGGWYGILAQQVAEDGTQQPIVTRFFHNKLYTLGRAFLTSYFTHYTGEFLFLTNGNPVRYRVPWVGIANIVDLLLLPVGLAILLAEGLKKKNPAYLLLVAWLAIGGVPAGLTWEDLPNIQRSSFMIPALIAATSLGAWELVNLSKKFRTLAIIGLSVLILHSFLYFFHMYFHHGKTHEPWHRSASEPEVVFDLARLAKTSPVVMTTSGNNNLIFHLFYRKFDPATFQAKGSPKEADGLVFENIRLTGNPCPMGDTDGMATGDVGTVYLSEYKCKIPKNGELLKTIYYPDGSPVFTITKIKPLP
ncbi:glycosyltransferase family 39 protein [Candidatus Gottesmanbacteria bacterium]|nr:glycosyltransferase family 39 protein [Candidatus Gottesmanbacteria bacterium]